MARRIDDALEQARWVAPIPQAVRRRPRLRAVVDDLDVFDRVGQRLVVGIGVQFDDRRFDGQGLRDMVAEELPGADDKVQSPRIKARGCYAGVLGRRPRVRWRPAVIAHWTFSTTCVTFCPTDHHAGGSGLTSGPIVTSTRLKGRSTSVPRTATGEIGTPACRAKWPIPTFSGRSPRPRE